METKKEIRRRLLNRRRELTLEERVRMSNTIMQKLLEDPWFQESDTIYGYVSYREEVDTHELLQYAIQMGKKVAVPKVLGNEMEFYYIEDLSRLNPGVKGIPEPKEDESMRACKEDALILMPLVGFDSKRNRLGYGGGYYDRYLERHPLHPTIGLAFSVQEVLRVPVEETDRRPSRILTEEKEV